MPKKKVAHAPLTPLFISVFRLNGTLIAAGDRLVADLETRRIEEAVALLQTVLARLERQADVQKEELQCA